MDLKSSIENRLEEIKKLRLNLHENAELAFNEYKTKNVIIDYLDSLGLQHDSCTATGVVSVLNEGEDCVAIRADMDALPINGTFHGCGHDYHMAVLLGAAAVLKDLGYKKCVKFIFQPAEEDTGGALPMIKEGVLKNPQVKNIVGFHVWPGVNLGTIEVSPKASMASVDSFDITFTGKGGHAAMPDRFINPLQPAVDFVAALNDFSASCYNPSDPHVLTVSSLNCGSAHNVVVNEAVVRGTLRTFNEDIRLLLKNKIFEIAEASSLKFKCSAEVNYDEQYPPLICDRAFTEKFIEETSIILGTDNVFPLEPTFAGEDFAFFAKAVPAVHFRLGITSEGYGEYPLHSPQFNAHEDVLFYGIYIITNFILSL